MTKPICEFLEKNHHEVSFRTLKTLFNDVASHGNTESVVNIQDLYDAIKSKKIELNISEEEMINLANALKITP